MGWCLKVLDTLRRILRATPRPDIPAIPRSEGRPLTGVYVWIRVSEVSPEGV